MLFRFAKAPLQMGHMRIKKEPTIGFEPITYPLRGDCSTK